MYDCMMAASQGNGYVGSQIVYKDAVAPRKAIQFVEELAYSSKTYLVGHVVVTPVLDPERWYGKAACFVKCNAMLPRNDFINCPVHYQHRTSHIADFLVISEDVQMVPCPSEAPKNGAAAAFGRALKHYSSNFRMPQSQFQRRSSTD
mmetsp:Transcript_85799/g.188376  ORF Transcript_85799/g.188376 Transcript_85799/m.188376 type:complete len:147 (+) Transcript_85799:2-442(+)